jgi:hypothetical protein
LFATRSFRRATAARTCDQVARAGCHRARTAPTDAGGREIDFTYTGDVLTSVNTPVGPLFMRYDEPGSVGPGIAPWKRLTSVTFPGGTQSRFTYGTPESNP